MIRINCTLYEFLRENMRTGISNMEDIHEMMLWSSTCIFRIPMTTVLIQITSFFKSGKSLKVAAVSQKLAHHYIKTASQLTWGNNTSASEFGFWIGGQNLAKSADFIGQNEKLTKNQNRKINIPSSFVFQIEASKLTIQRKN